MKAGECVTRPYPTLRNCPVSCGICTPVCLDIQPPSLPTARSEAEEERVSRDTPETWPRVTSQLRLHCSSLT